jgi:hypothetical protein
MSHLLLGSVPRGVGTGRHWRCPECGRVEWKPPGPAPACFGDPRGSHAKTVTQPAPPDDVATDERHLFT